MKNQIPSLFPDHLDEKNTITPAFPDLKRKTLRSLYGIDCNEGHYSKYNHELLMDKSPKGSVDEDIRPLVDLINAHPSFATLSSCSGRITLFDPNHAAQNTSMNNSDNDIDEEIITNNNNDEETITPTGTGKGYGAWLISCHGKITYSDLQQALNQHCHKFQNTDSSTPLIFKHEPLLLHVATSNLQRAHQLLTLAINLGFRESGTISSPKRITVAIRSMSLSLTVPLASKGTLRPNDEYLVELVKEANHRMTLNEAKLKALFESVKSTLFTIPSIHITNDNAASTTSSGDNTPTFQTHFQQLPDLNLWRHAAVVIPSPNHSETINNNNHCNNNVDIITFGGYGLGPNNNITKNPNRKCSRTNKVYRLRRTNGIWNSKWDEIIHSVDSQDHFNDVNHQPLHSLWNVQRTHFTEREGHSACILRLECNSLPSIQKHEKIAAIFGGRSSPSKANNDLFFFPCDSNPASFYKPVDVRGEHPTARWGHSLTPLLIPSKDGRLPLVALAGGRNESSVVSSVHILYQVNPENNDMNHFLWETLNASIPRFYHSAVSITPDQIFIFGGLESPLSLLGLDSSLSESGLQNTRKLPAFVLGLKTGDNSCDFLLDNGDSPTCLVNKYGAGACSLLHLDKNSNVPDSNVFVCLGGLSNESSTSNVMDDFPLEFYKYESSGGCKKYDFDTNTILNTTSDSIDFTSLVHHSCLLIPHGDTCDDNMCNEIVTVGGGVPSFAFGQSFAKSYSIQIMVGEDDNFKRDKIPSIENTSNNFSVIKEYIHNPPSGEEKKKLNMTDVIYVDSHNAKKVKNALEELSFLDKRYRMIKSKLAIKSRIDDSLKMNLIAIPITKSGLDSMSNPDSERYSFWSFVMSVGNEEVPYSTREMGKK